MNVPRGGYVLINLDDYNFNYSQATGEYEPVKVDNDIIKLIQYAYEKGKPVCINNIHNLDENGWNNLYTAEYGTVKPASEPNTYLMPYFRVNMQENTLTWR